MNDETDFLPRRTFLKSAGIGSTVDVGPTDDVVGIQEVSKASGVNVICCTGS